MSIRQPPPGTNPEGWEEVTDEDRDQTCHSERSDGTHCVHWWDDDGPCCYCGGE